MASLGLLSAWGFHSSQVFRLCTMNLLIPLPSISFPRELHDVAFGTAVAQGKAVEVGDPYDPRLL